MYSKRKPKGSKKYNNRTIKEGEGTADEWKNSKKKYKNTKGIT